MLAKQRMMLMEWISKDEKFVQTTASRIMAAVGDGAPRRDVDSTDRHRENEDGPSTLEDHHPLVVADLDRVPVVATDDKLNFSTFQPRRIKQK